MLNGAAIALAITDATINVSVRMPSTRQKPLRTSAKDRVIAVEDGQSLQHDQHGREQQHRVEVHQQRDHREQQRETEQDRQRTIADRRHQGKYHRDQPGESHHHRGFQQRQAEQGEQPAANLGPRFADGDRRTEHRPPDDDGEHAGQQHAAQPGDQERWPTSTPSTRPTTAQGQFVRPVGAERLPRRPAVRRWRSA